MASLAELDVAVDIAQPLLREAEADLLTAGRDDVVIEFQHGFLALIGCKEDTLGVAAGTNNDPAWPR
jgi:hypothetical protein